MSRTTLFIALLNFSSLAYATPDTVKIGTYVMSVHDINFHDQEYTSRFWLWFLYSNKEFDFERQLDITNAKSIDTPQLLEDSLEGKKWVLMKMKCTMKENWNVLDFPFDRQHLKIQIENSLYDKNDLVFKPDLKGSKFDSDETLAGWRIKNFKVSVIDNAYETGFGDDRIEKANQTFSAFLIEMDINRNAWGLFLKIFIGMYIAFLISMVGFAPHPGEVEPRFGLPVGGLFAAVGNKYIIDSILPESASFTLVDTLHAITFFTIFAILVVSAICLKLHDKEKHEACVRVNKIGYRFIGGTYVFVNFILVALAANN
ncbi:MAG TPA: hypothetical protein DGG95_11070 [Cytophagales bacterium]|jgi:hypothetical protein|nr:hypothetical protein [Cytophagales bacterium]